MSWPKARRFAPGSSSPWAGPAWRPATPPARSRTSSSTFRSTRREPTGLPFVSSSATPSKRPISRCSPGEPGPIWPARSNGSRPAQLSKEAPRIRADCALRHPLDLRNPQSARRHQPEPGRRGAQAIPRGLSGPSQGRSRRARARAIVPGPRQEHRGTRSVHPVPEARAGSARFAGSAPRLGRAGDGRVVQSRRDPPGPAEIRRGDRRLEGLPGASFPTARRAPTRSGRFSIRSS